MPTYHQVESLVNRFLPLIQNVKHLCKHLQLEFPPFYAEHWLLKLPPPMHNTLGIFIC